MEAQALSSKAEAMALHQELQRLLHDVEKKNVMLQQLQETMAETEVNYFLPSSLSGNSVGYIASFRATHEDEVEF